MQEPRTALVLSYSTISSDPRVRRQVDWLTNSGWVVDTLGLGDHPTEDVREHFVIAEPKRWTRGKLGTLVSHVVLRGRTRFRVLLSGRIPARLRRSVREGAYDLIVFNEYEFAPWVEDRRDFPESALRGRLHLDLHEYRNPSVRRRTLGGRLTGAHYRWVRAHLGSARFTSRTVVNTPIGELYAEEFGFQVPVPVRNAPPFVPDLEPTPVDPGDIKLLFHGLPSWQRGFEEILEALETLPPRFSMTFMLMPNPAVHRMLEDAVSTHPARSRIRIVPPAPMREIAQHINGYDLEVIFYKPLEPNLRFAMPNKFFEAAQGGLGVVVGETPTMAPLVREHGHGVVVPEFTAESLRATLATLDADGVTRMKARARLVARQMNAESEGESFLRAIEGEDRSREDA
jgi:glycosyltransferase involved in cell wall biosynthesis